MTEGGVTTSKPVAGGTRPVSRARTYAVAAFVLLALIWGLSWPLMKMTMAYAEPFSFAAMRGVISSVVLLAALPVLRRPLKPPPLGWTALLGFFQTAGFAGLSFWALESGGAGRISVLTYTMPFWLLLMARAFMGEKVRGWQWVAVALALVGLLLILSPWELRGVKSSLLAVATGVAWAASAVVAKVIHTRHRVDVFSLTAWQMALGTIPLLVLAFATGFEPPQWTLPFVALLVFQVVLSNGLAWIIWLFVLRVLPAGTTGLASLANPVLGVLFSWAILSDRPALVEGLGMASVLLGIAVLTLRGALAKGVPASVRAATFEAPRSSQDRRRENSPPS